MATYRMYRLDGDGRISAADWLEAGDDKEALTDARRLSGGSRFELWEGKRLVQRVEATKRASPRKT